MDGSVIRYKARLVAQGFSQKFGCETFSPVVRGESIRALLALATQENMHLHQMDVQIAFLNGDLHEEVYMRQPEGYEVKGKEHQVCKLHRSIYGLKQSPWCWNHVLDEYWVTPDLQRPMSLCFHHQLNSDSWCVCRQFSSGRKVRRKNQGDEAVIIASIQDARPWRT